jgi:hypothetical protein
MTIKLSYFSAKLFKCSPGAGTSWRISPWSRESVSASVQASAHDTMKFRNNSIEFRESKNVWFRASITPASKKNRKTEKWVI